MQIWYFLSFFITESYAVKQSPCQAFLSRWGTDFLLNLFWGSTGTPTGEKREIWPSLLTKGSKKTCDPSWVIKGQWHLTFNKMVRWIKLFQGLFIAVKNVQSWEDDWYELAILRGRMTVIQEKSSTTYLHLCQNKIAKYYSSFLLL